MQLNCNHCRELLWSYLSKELSDFETKKIEEHLQGCPSCRAEAEQLAPVVASLREEIPLPATFSAELHQKLSLAAQEMAEEKTSLGKRLSRMWKDLSSSKGFRALAPSLVCLVLVVGVFSSGLFDQWQNADRMLREKSVPNSTHTETLTPIPEKTNPTEEPSPAAEKNPVSVAPAPAEREIIPTPAAEPSVPPAEHTPDTASVIDVPAPASLEQEDTPIGLAISRQYDKVTCLTLLDVQTFLDDWQTASGYNWKTYLLEADTPDLPPGIDADATVLQFSAELTESLLSFEESLSVVQDGISAEESEFLIIITEDEE